MTTTETQAPTLETLADVTGGTIARSGDHVLVGYGPLGYLTVRPTTVYSGGAEVPAGEISGKLRNANGAKHTALRETLRAAGIYPC